MPRRLRRKKVDPGQVFIVHEGRNTYIITLLHPSGSWMVFSLMRSPDNHPDGVIGFKLPHDNFVDNGDSVTFRLYRIETYTIGAYKGPEGTPVPSRIELRNSDNVKTLDPDRYQYYVMDDKGIVTICVKPNTMPQV